MNARVLTSVFLMLTSLSLINCRAKVEPDSSAQAWPAFVATFRETRDAWFRETRLDYHSPESWEFVVLDASDPADVSRRITYDGRVVKYFKSDGELEDEKEEGAGILPPLGEWGYPNGSAEQILGENKGWKLQDDGTIAVTRTFPASCEDDFQNCEGLEEKIFVRDSLGLPLSFERRINGRLVRQVQRVALELLAPVPQQ